MDTWGCERRTGVLVVVVNGRVLMFIFIDACLLLKVQSVVIRFIVHTVQRIRATIRWMSPTTEIQKRQSRLFCTQNGPTSHRLFGTRSVFFCCFFRLYVRTVHEYVELVSMFFFLSTFYRGLFNCCKRGIPTDYYRCRLYGSFIIQQRFVRCALVTTEWNTLNVGPRQWWRWLLLLVW